MNFGEIFQETMKAFVRGDHARMEELTKLQDEKIAKLKNEKLYKNLGKSIKT